MNYIVFLFAPFRWQTYISSQKEQRAISAPIFRNFFVCFYFCVVVININIIIIIIIIIIVIVVFVIQFSFFFDYNIYKI